MIFFSSKLNYMHMKSKYVLAGFALLAIGILLLITMSFSCGLESGNKNIMNQNNQIMPRDHQGMMGNQNRNQQSGQWTAPVSANKLKNPFGDNAPATVEGKKIFIAQCAICHGDKGIGDGAAGGSLNPKPANLTSEKVKNQSDGAIFWKITTGNSPMPSYKLILTEEKRWQLVNYIRKLQSK